jgi:hypothetical protein
MFTPGPSTRQSLTPPDEKKSFAETRDLHLGQNFILVPASSHLARIIIEFIASSAFILTALLGSFRILSRNASSALSSPILPSSAAASARE